MKFEPANRHILVEHIVTEKSQDEDFGILLPEDYKPVESPYIAVRVVDWDRQKVSLQLHAGSTVIVNRSMVEQISYHGHNFYVVLENYVVGTLTTDVESGN